VDDNGTAARLKNSNVCVWVVSGGNPNHSGRNDSPLTRNVTNKSTDVHIDYSVISQTLEAGFPVPLTIRRLAHRPASNHSPVPKEFRAYQPNLPVASHIPFRQDHSQAQADASEWGRKLKLSHIPTFTNLQLLTPRIRTARISLRPTRAERPNSPHRTVPVV
jgi:hypothetical protein